MEEGIYAWNVVIFCRKLHGERKPMLWEVLSNEASNGLNRSSWEIFFAGASVATDLWFI